MRPASASFVVLLMVLTQAPCALAGGSREPAAVAAMHAVAAPAGELVVDPRRDLLRSLALGIEGDLGKAALRLPLQATGPLGVQLERGMPVALHGAMAVPGLRLVHNGRRTPVLSLRASHGGSLSLALVDKRGAEWLRLVQPMRSPSLVDGLGIVTADLRIGPALAGWLGNPGSQQLLVANVSLRVPLMQAYGASQAKSCAVPNWPGTPGFVTDVLLVDMPRVDVLRCRLSTDTTDTCSGGAAYGCDGPGPDDGEVVLVPSATLKNRDAADAADVPWFRKFIEPDPVLYPPGVDQHPYLVWNLYRLDADGMLAQIGRSGLKHAFATANENCHPDAGCPWNGNILGRACEDMYNAGSNDLYNPAGTANANALVSRRELIPATGQWGRCGSEFDDEDRFTEDGLEGCDAYYDAPPALDCRYRHRLVARESAIDPALHPGSRFFIDAWYLVRDDADIFNTMGFREIHPTWQPGALPPRWHAGQPGPFRSGSIVDLWLEQAAPGEWTRRSVLDTGSGRVLLAARVRRTATGYRYDYALANLDLVRATTSGSEPNLRILTHEGVHGFAVEGLHGSTPVAPGTDDGDTLPDNDWSVTSQAAALHWTAPDAGAELGWGSLRTFSLHAADPPSTVRAWLKIGASDPAEWQVQTLGPDRERVFEAGFE